MQALKLVLPIKPHINQMPILKSKARFNVIPAGRRFGKSEIEKLKAIYTVLEGKHVWWVNPTFDNTYEAWLTFLGFFSQFVSDDYINKSRREIRVPNMGVIRMVGANNFKRGTGIDRLFIDEAAFCQLEYLWDSELRPMLLDNPNTGADFFSSTNGRNFFWKLYTRGLDPNESDWQAFHYTSYDNPLLDANEIDDIKRHTPEHIFKQEYLAEFIEDGGAVFRDIMSCVGDSLVINADEATHIRKLRNVVMGVDLGRHNDYTVLIAMDRDTKVVLDIDRFTEISWDLQAIRIHAMAKRWYCKKVIIEENFNDSFVERLANEGLQVEAYRTTHQSKQSLINELALAFEQHDIHIPRHDILLSELQAFGIEKLPSGGYRYSAPSGMHDDTVIALGLAWRGVLQAPAKVIRQDYV